MHWVAHDEDELEFGGVLGRVGSPADVLGDVGVSETAVVSPN